MASVRELKTKWQLRFKDTRRVPSQTTVSVSKSAYRTKTQAKRYAQHLEHRYRDPEDPLDLWSYGALNGALPPPGGLTLVEAADQYVAYKERLGERDVRGGWNAHTYQSTAPVILDFARQIGGPASALTSAQAEDFIYRDDLESGGKRSYRRKIGTFLRWLREQGHNDRVEKPPPLKSKQKLPEYCTWSQLQAICIEHEASCVQASKYAKNFSSEHYVDVWNFAFFQGLRKEELAELRPEDVDLYRDLVRVGRPDFDVKMGKDRVIPLTPEGKMCVRRYVEQSGHRFGRLFHRKNGHYFSTRFTEARKRAFPERKGLHLHRLRNSCAIFWLQQEKPLIWIRDLLGHSSVSTLEKYLRALGRTRRF